MNVPTCFPTQPANTGGFGAREVPNVRLVRYKERYLYGTTLRTDVEEWHGLELEYAACREDYTYVFIRSVLRESRIGTVRYDRYGTVRKTGDVVLYMWAWSWRRKIFGQRCRILYFM